MTGNSIDCPDNPWRFEGETVRPAKPHEGLFSDLTQIEALHIAYAQLCEALAVESSFNGTEAPSAGDDVNSFFEQLSKDLRAGNFPAKHNASRPDANKVSDRVSRTNLRNRIVQIAITNVLERVFPTDSPGNPVAWTAAAIGSGLRRVYAVTIDESEADRSEHILATVRQRVADPAFLTLLGNVLKSIDFRGATGPNPLALVLNRIALHHIDQLLHEANLLGRQGSNIHAMCIRFDWDVALFLDCDAQYDWLLPALQKRLREALAESKAEIDPEKTQLVDLARGEKLHFLDHEFRLRKDRDGPACVEYKRLVKPPEPTPEGQKPSRRSWNLPVPAWPRRVRPKPIARAEAPSGRRFHWPSLDLRWPRWSWNFSLNVPRRVYAVVGGVIIGTGMLAGTAVVVALLRGHGPQLYPVRGRVFYEGKPAVGALVVFLPQDPATPQAHIASALVAPDGSYVLGTHKPMDGALAGPYVVTIWSRQSTTARLPARYASRRTTPLTAIVEMGPTDVPVVELQVQSP